MNWSHHYDNYAAPCETGHRSVLWSMTQPPTQTVVWLGTASQCCNNQSAQSDRSVNPSSHPLLAYYTPGFFRPLSLYSCFISISRDRTEHSPYRLGLKNGGRVGFRPLLSTGSTYIRMPFSRKHC
ncbi:hypothetical protein JTE90_020929 [Oedothorax gibbosus]|uniref:Uncharacterized protein n=1 Tax=Oedothorax gibbosus TaxID=931172 RepID=A0AAV6VQR5_9ARAC|nr:hypothetical protein JTE90_020929 [Oedothorax gibbosus]